MLFICYRRDDSGENADRLRVWLEERMGKDAVFMDVVSITGAINWRQHVEEMIIKSKSVIVVIGSTWLSDRLTEKDDAVRFEIECAIKNNIPLIPILVNDAQMPGRQQLPQSIADIADINATRIRSGKEYKIEWDSRGLYWDRGHTGSDDKFSHHIDRLSRSISK